MGTLRKLPSLLLLALVYLTTKNCRKDWSSSSTTMYHYVKKDLTFTIQMHTCVLMLRPVEGLVMGMLVALWCMKGQASWWAWYRFQIKHVRAKHIMSSRGWARINRLYRMQFVTYPITDHFQSATLLPVYFSAGHLFNNGYNGHNSSLASKYTMWKVFWYPSHKGVEGSQLRCTICVEQLPPTIQNV